MRIVFNLMGLLKMSSGGLQVIKQQMYALKNAGFEVGKFLIPFDTTNALNEPFIDFPLVHVNDAKPNDIFVVSEEFIWVAHDHYIPNNINYVVLNQGVNSAFFSEKSYEEHVEVYDKAAGVIVNSNHTYNGVKLFFEVSSNKIFRFRIGIDDKLFYPEPKENIITYYSGKNCYFSAFFKTYIKGNYKHLNIVPMNNVTKDVAAKIMRRAKLFLSFGGPEGFGMPPLEAAFCGCKVLGFDGDGGKEFFRHPLFTSVPFYDYNDFAYKLDDVISELDEWSIDHEDYLNYLRNFYSLEKSNSSIISSFIQIGRKLNVLSR